jgi:DNA polymerase-3 subunit gamma/tau
MKDLSMDIYNIVRPKSYIDMFETSDFVSAMRGMTIENAPHALLFYGTYGCGKTTAARLYARFLNDLDDDITDSEMIEQGYIIEINAADNRKIDDVRLILNRIKDSFVSYDNTKTVFIFNEVHQLLVDSQKAFLELFDLLHGNAYVIFTTTNIDGIRPELASRFERYSFHTLTMQETYALICNIYKKIELEPPQKTDPIIKTIYDYSNGNPRLICTLISKYIKTNSLSTNDMSYLVRNADSTASSDNVINKLMDDFMNNVSSIQIMKTFSNIVYSHNIETIKYGMIEYINKRFLLKAEALNYRALELEYHTNLCECLRSFKCGDVEYFNKTEFISIMTRMLLIRYKYVNDIKNLR